MLRSMGGSRSQVRGLQLPQSGWQSMSRHSPIKGVARDRDFQASEDALPLQSVGGLRARVEQLQADIKVPLSA